VEPVPALEPQPPAQNEEGWIEDVEVFDVDAGVFSVSVMSESCLDTDESA
jgi:hypothetical protein